MGAGSDKPAQLRGKKADSEPDGSCGEDAVVSDRTRPTPRPDAMPVCDPAREELHRFAEVLAREFNDQAPFGVTLSRLVNLYHRADLPPEAFADRVDAARQRTKERTATIRRPSGGPVKKNKIPYFFALLEESLGMRAPSSAPPSEPGRSAPPRDAPDAVTAREPERHRAMPTSRAGDGPDTQTPSLPPPGASPSLAVVSADARVIREVVREFSQQFCEYAAAAALGDWAVTLWQRSGMSRQRFLDVAQMVSEGLARDGAGPVTAPLFQSRLADALVPVHDGRGARVG